jgi:hypothetical protein
MSLEGLGRILILSAVFLLLLGLVLIVLGRLGFVRLPGDLFYRRGNFTFFFPVMTAIVLSLVLTVLLNLFSWLWRR